MFSTRLQLRSRRVWLRAAATLVLLACGRGDDRGAPAAANVATARDDFGAPILVPRDRAARPARIVSLNPTTTELLFALGVGPRVVGRTHWDLYPDSARAVPDLGDGLRPNVEAVLATQPQLVVLYASADNRAAADALRRAGIAVVALKIDSIAEFYRAVRTLGDVVGAPDRARALVDSVSRSIAHVRAVTEGSTRPSVVWPLFDQPLYVIGGGSFLSELIDVAGGRNVFADSPQPSPQMSQEEVLRRDADVVLAGASSAAHIRTDPGWAALRAVRSGRVLVVDPTLVERPSVRLGEAARAIALLLHPELRGRLLADSAAR